MSDFPSEAYTCAQQKWLGRDHLITPTIRKAFGDILTGKRVLDVGCGNGHYSFDFLHWGASAVVGIDNSVEMIEICDKQKSPENEHKISFHQADISDFSLTSSEKNSENLKKFDIATAFFVLQFIHEKSKLTKAIQNISEHLNSGGVLFGLIPNGVEGVRAPEDMGKKLGAQIQKKKGSGFVDGEIVDICFYDNEEVCGVAQIALHSREFYESSFKSAGFSKIEWIAPHFTEHAQKLLGSEFCAQFLSPPCDIMFRCVKE